MTENDITLFVGQLTEDQAYTAIHAIRDRFGWVGTEFTRGDAQSAFADAVKDEEAEMPNEVWDAVRSSWEWQNIVTDGAMDCMWTMVYQAIETVLDEVPTRYTEEV